MFISVTSSERAIEYVNDRTGSDRPNSKRLKALKLI